MNYHQAVKIAQLSHAPSKAVLNRISVHPLAKTPYLNQLTKEIDYLQGYAITRGGQIVKIGLGENQDLYPIFYSDIHKHLMSMKIPLETKIHLVASDFQGGIIRYNFEIKSPLDEIIYAHLFHNNLTFE